MSQEFSNDDVVFITDFPGMSRDKAHGFCRVINAYFASGFDWEHVKSLNIVSAPTLYRYLRDPDFNAKINELLEPHKRLNLSKAINIYYRALDEAENWADKLKAADRITAAYSPDQFDPATRREIARTKGDLINKIAVVNLSRAQQQAIIKKDPFRALPESTGEVLDVTPLEAPESIEEKTRVPPDPD
jgi:hypothetical protein